MAADCCRTISRRRLLQGTAGGLGLAALGLFDADAVTPRRGLIAVSAAGDDEAGVGPSISVLDATSGEVRASVPAAGKFSFPATRWDPARDTVWSGVPGGPDQAVQVFSLSSGARRASIATGSSQNYVELVPGGRHAIVAARFVDRYLKIGADPAADDFGRVVARLDTYDGASPCDMTITADGRYAYVPDRGGDTVTTIDLADFSIASSVALERTAPGALQPYMGTVSPVGDVLVMENAEVEGGSATGSVSIFDLSDRRRPAEVARLDTRDGLGRGPIEAQFMPDGRHAMVVCRDSSSISVVDVARRAVVHTVELPEGSRPVTGTFAYGAAGHRFFVPLPGRDAVAIIDTPAFALARLVPVGPRPLGAVYLEARPPRQAASRVPLGLALAHGRAFPADCPDPCCGTI